MSIEPQRSQYLEAMGLTAWVSRYRLPNAAPTSECEWLEPEIAPSQPPAKRLHALLDAAEPAPPASVPRQAPTQTAPSQHRKRARALLEVDGGDVSEPRDAPPVDSETPAQETKPASREAAQESLRFSLQIAALDGRWLVLLPDRHEPGADAQRLLTNLLQAAGIVAGAAPVFQTFHWPMMEGQPVEAPLDEARDGLRAFVEGRKRRGWRPERLLMFGEDETLDGVLELDSGHCRLLDIPGWQGPSLSALANSATAKRALWAYLHDWRRAWHDAADGALEEASQDASVNHTASDDDATS